MTPIDLQRLVGAKPDGVWMLKSKASLLAHFANRKAPAISSADITKVAQRLGCSYRQLEAVRTVESAGRGFDADGRPKILFERHKFHRYTGGRFSPARFSMSAAGGYTIDADGNGINDSWDKLSDAIATGEVDAAFMSTSWGAFQVMGEWWDELGYDSPFAMAASCIASEAAHLEILARYIEYHRLMPALAAITSNPVTCRPFAAAYNGPGYRANRYDEKLAERMAA
jgi:hypothetical protein